MSKKTDRDAAQRVIVGVLLEMNEEERQQLLNTMDLILHDQGKFRQEVEEEVKRIEN